MLLTARSLIVHLSFRHLSDRLQNLVDGIPSQQLIRRSMGSSSSTSEGLLIHGKGKKLTGSLAVLGSYLMLLEPL